jgi:ubiquinone/menaquinone biosynthesis C-methylase UbiE
VVPPRDVAAFEARASTYEHGWRGRLHHEITDRTANLVLSVAADPLLVLDVGCGTGYLLRRLATSYRSGRALFGVDPAPSMIEEARRGTDDERLRFLPAVAEQLPFRDRSFDLVVSTTSFDHWSDQLAGLRECARVLVPGGRLVLVDQFSWWLAPTLLAGRRGKARTKRRVTRLLVAAGFSTLAWHDLYALIIKAGTATAMG